MDAFIVRKRKREDGTFVRVPPAHTTKLGAKLKDEHEHEPTDIKLAILASKFPDIDSDTLLDILIAHDGSVALASSVLSASVSGEWKPSAFGIQGTLRQFRTPSGSQRDTLESTLDGITASKKRQLTRKGATLHLYDARDIAQHTPCTIIHNFLPSTQANDLLQELLDEAETFQQEKFKLFENIVASAHTNAFYVETYDQEHEQRTSYAYNGCRIKDVRLLTPHLATVKPIVASAVNTAIQSRISSDGGQKLPFQSPDPWSPNVALVNCYRGGTETVGWHTDHLTYLGPRAVVGSLSLGVAREFRVRRILAKEPPKDKIADGDTGAEGLKSDEDEDLGGQIAIHLPHNSLLVMHADMQEEWKHTIAPASSIDPHPIAGNVRINITYRDYKAYMHPRHTPLCKCGVSCVLRVVQKKKGSRGRYFWMCYANYVPGKEGCDYFVWAQFDDDGRPLNMRNQHLFKERPEDGAADIKLADTGTGT